MNNRTAQWIIWAALMLVFSFLTLTSRWLDLALALTISGVIWYGIVPKSSSGDNKAKAAKSR
jgi:hypothetical protein